MPIGQDDQRIQQAVCDQGVADTFLRRVSVRELQTAPCDALRRCICPQCLLLQRLRRCRVAPSRLHLRVPEGDLRRAHEGDSAFVLQRLGALSQSDAVLPVYTPPRWLAGGITPFSRRYTAICP